MTPGDEVYYAAAQRGRVDGPTGPGAYSSDMPGGPQDVLGLGNQRALAQQQQQQPISQQQYVQQQRAPPAGSSYVTSRSRHPGNPAGGVAGGAGLVQYEWDGADGPGAEEEEELELEHEHGELMESILEDEEEIIALHRQQIEDAMEVVRRWVAHSVAGWGAIPL